MNVDGSGASPLNDAPEKSNPGFSSWNLEGGSVVRRVRLALVQVLWIL
jgi:hypothetical protein